MAAKFQPKRIRSEEDRNRGRGQFVRLKAVNDQFMGYALFKANPKADKNPGWYEFEQHYTTTTGYVPCFGDNCPICDMGSNASDRAIAAFLVVDSEDDSIEEGEVKLFEMNYYVIQEFAEYEQDEGVLGRLFRLKRGEGNGKYTIRPKKEKLKAADIKAAVADIPEIEKMLVNRMAAVAEELEVTDAMETDEDAADEEPKARKGKSAAKAKPEPEPVDETDDFDPDDADEFAGTVEVVKIVKSKNIATVQTEGGTKFDVYGTDEVDLTDLAKGDSAYIEAQKDSDDDYVVSILQESEDAAESEGDASDGEFSGDEYAGSATITAIDSSEETMEVETPDGDKFTLWFLDEGDDDNDNDWADFDLDDYAEGDVVEIVAARDEDGDMLASAFPEKAKKARRKKTKA